ncbi:hypothetical protein ACTZWW_11500 [Salinarimonas sp. NSM]|uniref:hypothetical protein n=1 Tax=Salinarimonas sp. NSM TaxID=3458003 RepID=UPI004036ECA6
MTPADLIATARTLVRGRRGRPRQANLKRAVSTAYYATFHAVARICANALVGASKARTDAWVLTYRGLQHGFAKDVLARRDTRAMHGGVHEFASAFVLLQEMRHQADYDPRASFTPAEAIAAIDDAESGIAALAAVPAAIRLDLAARLLFKPRP